MLASTSPYSVTFAFRDRTVDCESYLINEIFEIQRKSMRPKKVLSGKCNVNSDDENK